MGGGVDPASGIGESGDVMKRIAVVLAVVSGCAKDTSALEARVAKLEGRTVTAAPATWSCFWAGPVHDPDSGKSELTTCFRTTAACMAARPSYGCLLSASAWCEAAGDEECFFSKYQCGKNCVETVP